MCLDCPLYGDGSGYVPVHGTASSGVLLVGDLPGEQEARAGEPFVGAAGFYLDRILKRAGLLRSSFALHNVLSCRPPNNWLVGAPYEAAAISSCTPYLERTIRDTNPRVIVALGNTALRRLVPEADNIARHRGFVLDRKDGRFVVPTYHPSFLLPRPGQANTSRFLGVVIRDIRRAVRIARDGFTRTPMYPLLDPSVVEFSAWIDAFSSALRRNPDLFLSFDIETPYKLKTNEDDITDDEDDAEEQPAVGELSILRISFCYQAGHAVTVPFNGEYLAGIKFLLATAARKCVWNGVRFDVPILETAGVPVHGRVYDFMWGFHMWQSDLPKSLEAASSLLTDLTPWKHLSDANAALYNAMDADAQLRCGLALKDELAATGQWAIFERHMVDLDPLLMAMGQRGVLIDQPAQDALRVDLEGEQHRLVTEAQLVVPEAVRPRTEYKRVPGLPLDPGDTPVWKREGVLWREFRPRTIETDVKVCSHCGVVVTSKSVHLKGGKKNPCAAATMVKQPGAVIVYDQIDDFNPNSVHHMITYAKYFDHPVALHHKTRKETLDKKAVAALAKTKGKKHPIYQIALTLRGVKKTLGTYVEGFRPDSAGLIHTTFGHHPSSLRLSARNVNTTNISHRGGVAYAERVRRTIIPRPGLVFVEADSSAIEAVMTGYFMGSAEYVALAKKGIHDYLNCLEHKLPFDEEGIARSKTEFKDARDRQKIVVHGTSYGMTPYLMYKSWPEIFPTVASAETAQKHFFAACPGLAEWQHAVRTFAHKNSYLENPWGYRHYFYDVFTKRNGIVELGSDGNRVVSFKPQSSAAAFLKDNIFLLAETPWWPLPAIGVIHDSYCLEVAERDVDEAVRVLTAILTRPIAEMGGLTVGCEVKVSVPDATGVRHWDSMEKIKCAA